MGASDEGDLRSNDEGLRYLIDIGQKKMKDSRAGRFKKMKYEIAENEKMEPKYVTGFGFSNLGQKRSRPEKMEKETDPIAGYLMMGFGFANALANDMFVDPMTNDKVNILH